MKEALNRILPPVLRRTGIIIAIIIAVGRGKSYP